MLYYLIIKMGISCSKNNINKKKLSDIKHDLNNNLNTIYIIIHLLNKEIEKNNPDKNEIEQYINNIKEQLSLITIEINNIN